MRAPQAYIGAAPEGATAGAAESAAVPAQVSGPGSGAAVVVVAEGEEEAVLPRVPFDACLQRFSGAEVGGGRWRGRGRVLRRGIWVSASECGVFGGWLPR